MSKEFKFFIYLLERYAEHLGVTADIAYRRLAEKNLVDYAVDMYGCIMLKQSKTLLPTWMKNCRHNI